MLLDSYSAKRLVYIIRFLLLLTNILIFQRFKDNFSDVEGHYICIYYFPVPPITCLY